ncbi:hypothetical protein N5P37_001258, partial [Trichoderma harzianum]
APGAGGGARDKLIGRGGGVKTLERPLRFYCIVFQVPFFPWPCLNSVACSLTCSHATTSSANEDEACRFSMDRPVVSQIWLSSVYCLLLLLLRFKCSYMHTHMQVLIHVCTLEMDESLRGGVGIYLLVGWLRRTNRAVRALLCSWMQKSVVVVLCLRARRCRSETKAADGIARMDARLMQNTDHSKSLLESSAASYHTHVITKREGGRQRNQDERDSIPLRHKRHPRY